ncbi:PREDICTED: BRCA2 and CDKN1A-interacting protein [Nanorana parkeri]|uniref:BRCA2 and CDKN1A-interacting protein n=1 Tax=Nanorana parkeri TaxID=125878 RepID=UPI00085457B0|nr:PREDICTED: BRCA2 and CDKN1A-interacting protein [Nanorana parkeri]
MASSAKRRAVEDEAMAGDEEDDDSDISEDEDSEQDEDLDEEVNVDFEAHTMCDSDKDGIQKLLKQLFLKAHVNIAELADLLIQQNHIGSVIKQAEGGDDSDDDVEDDHVFGFISLLNLTERKDTPCADEVMELILSHCEKNCDQSAADQLEKVLNDNSKPVGLLLSERFINVPAQIALPMHQQLQKELAEAQQTNKPCGKCYYYLIISKTFMEPEKKSQGKEEMMFANAEDEFFYEKAVLKFNYSVQEECDSQLVGKWSFDDVPMKPLRTVMLVPAARMNSIIAKFKEYLSV